MSVPVAESSPPPLASGLAVPSSPPSAVKGEGWGEEGEKREGKGWEKESKEKGE